MLKRALLLSTMLAAAPALAVSQYGNVSGGNLTQWQGNQQISDSGISAGSLGGGPFIPIAGNSGEPMTGALYFDGYTFIGTNGFGDADFTAPYLSVFIADGNISGTGAATIFGGRYATDDGFFTVNIESGFGYATMGDEFNQFQGTYLRVDDNNQYITGNATQQMQFTSTDIIFTLSPQSYNNFIVNSAAYPYGTLNIHSSGTGYGSFGDFYNTQYNTYMAWNDDTRQITMNAANGFYFTGSPIGFNDGLYNINTGLTTIDASGNIYYGSGNPFSSGSTIYYNTGQILSNGDDLNFYQQFTQNGNVFIDSSGFFHTPSGLKDNSGSAGTTGQVLTSLSGAGTKYLSAPVVISSTTSINGKTVANTSLYTVPAARTLIVTDVVVHCTFASSITVPATAGIGTTAGTSNLFAATSLTSLTTTTAIYKFDSVSGASVSVAAGGQVYFNLTVGATGTSQTFAVDLIGYLL